jgi:hypothetical protein
MAEPVPAARLPFGEASVEGAADLFLRAVFVDVAHYLRLLLQVTKKRPVGFGKLAE